MESPGLYSIQYLRLLCFYAAYFIPSFLYEHSLDLALFPDEISGHKLLISDLRLLFKKFYPLF